LQHYRHDLGAIDRDRTGAGAAVHLERDFDATPDELWELLTDPAELAEWLCARVDLEPRPGGTIILHFDNSHTTVRGRVVHFDAPVALEYTWQQDDEPASVVRFALHPAPANTGTRLTVTHTHCTGAAIGQMAAGWHHHLELLATQLARQPVAWNWSRFEDLHAQYSSSAA
jgi:uncharacterized protein YndB with AHSA1/START domain